jgi:predicted DNA-binding transcriptional regulator YafY
LKDGRTLLTMTASGKEEIKAWILSFGAKAELLSAKSLRDEVRADLSKTLANYN